MSDKQFRWGIMGGGQIANVFCNALRFSSTSMLYAIASLNPTRRQHLAKQFQSPKQYAQYEDLCNDPDVDAIYIATQNSAHAQCAILAAKYGKHVLVEKPIAITEQECSEMITAAHKSNIHLMEGFMYQFHPQMKYARELIQSGRLGEVKYIESSFGYHADPRSHRVFKSETGGGAILDVGCYPVSMSRWLAQVILDTEYEEPVKLKACGHLGVTGVDTHSSLILQFPKQLLATISTSILVDLPNQTIVCGTEGQLTFTQPWLPSSPCRLATQALPLDTIFPPTKIQLDNHNNTREEVIIRVNKDLFSYEIDAFVTRVQHKTNQQSSWSNSLQNLKILSQWRHAL